MNQDLAMRHAFAALRHGIVLSLGDPRMRRRIVVSILVNGVVFAMLLASLSWVASQGVAWAFDGAEVADPTWYESAWYAARGGLRWVLWFVLGLGVLLYAPVLFVLLASVVLPPFHGPVFAAARTHSGGPSVEATPVSMGSSLLYDLKRLVRFVGLSLLLLPLNLLPVIGSVAYLVAQFLLSARTLGWDLLSHHFELHGMGLEAQEEWVGKRRALVFGLGAGATLLAMLPLVQIVFITTNVAGAGVLSAWLDGAPRKH
ncbi:MAG: EI24 domain-containing protein [Myxococcota bacterium]